MKSLSGKTLSLFARVMAAAGMAEEGDFDTARTLMAEKESEEGKTCPDRVERYWSQFRILHQDSGSK